MHLDSLPLARKPSALGHYHEWKFQWEVTFGLYNVTLRSSTGANNSYCELLRNYVPYIDFLYQRTGLKMEKKKKKSQLHINLWKRFRSRAENKAIPPTYHQNLSLTGQSLLYICSSSLVACYLSTCSQDTGSKSKQTKIS